MNVFYSYDDDILYLKVNFQGKSGYTCYLQHKHLNYPSSNELLKNIQTQGRFLIRNAYYDAYEFQKSSHDPLDQVLFKNHSLFFKGQLNHFADTIKIKLTGDIVQDQNKIAELSKSFSSLRLDCNYLYPETKFETLISSFDETLLSKIDYIEDPFLDFENQFTSNINLASDHSYNLNAIKSTHLKIYRPTIFGAFPKKDKLVFSNQFDCILGAWQSYNYYKKFYHLLDKETHQGLYNPSYSSLYIKHKNFLGINLKLVTQEYQKIKEFKWTGI